MSADHTHKPVSSSYPDRSWNKGVFGVIDIGSRRTTCLIGRGLVDGRIDIRAHAWTQTKGVQHGCITDIKKASHTISDVLARAENAAKTSLAEVCINISCGNPTSRPVTVKAYPKSGRVTHHDISSLYRRAFDYIDQLDPTKRAVQCFPINFDTQSLQGIQDPTGHTASILMGKFLTLSVDKEQLSNLEKIVLRSGVEISDMIPAAVASALSVMTPEDPIVGVTVINIGAETTSWAVFHGGSLQDFGQFPQGSHQITTDLIRNFGIDYETAEKLKNTDGTVDYEKSADDTYKIELPPGSRRKNNTVTRNDLSRFIKPGMERILRNAKAALTKSRFLGAKDCNIILTGGGSQLDGIEDFATRILGKDTQVGHINICSIPEEYRNQTAHLTSAIGILAWQLGMNKEYGMSKILKKPKTSFWSKFLPFKR